MTRNLERGDVVHQVSNDTLWWIYEVRESERALGTCIRGGRRSVFSYDAYPIGETDMPFEVRPPYDSGVSLVDPKDVPEDLWPLIAQLAMGIDIKEDK